jgi:UDP-N-acetylglucosamine 2-epimerase (non-hydrolysing)
MKLMSVVGARPNFMKIAPFVRALKRENDLRKQGNRTQIEHILVHTGQHYDERMSANFFDSLDIPRPEIDLGVGSGTHAEQVGRTMIAFERAVQDHRPDWVVVVGDVNATCACSLTAKKEGVNVAHIEAGLRSRDMSMPEEINRIVTDRLSDLLFATEEIACENLRQEGVPKDRVKLVGNIMIDTLEANRGRAMALRIDDILRQNILDGPLKETPVDNAFALITLHRPSNVDHPEILGSIVDFLCHEVAEEMPLIWAIHPRTRKMLESFGLWGRAAGTRGVILLQPLGYLDMLRLNMGARILLTDSGGLQEESCVLGTPCITLRWNTERPVTLSEYGGVSELAGNHVTNIRPLYHEMKNRAKIPHTPPLWDGRTAERIVSCFAQMDV